jgi:hypothetical protein
MSNEFEVHNFYNHDLKELEQIKDEFMGLWNSAVAFKEGMKDIGKLSMDEWYKKHENIEDYMVFEYAEQEYNNGNSIVEWQGVNYRYPCKITDLFNKGFKDVIYKNDTCPSYENSKANIVVYLVDLKNQECQRYFQHNYYIYRFDEKKGVHAEPSASTDSFEDMLTIVKALEVDNVPNN